MWLRLIVTPLSFAVRRIRRQRLSFAAVAIALAVGGALIGWTSTTGALAQERSVRARLESLPRLARSITFTYFTVAEEPDQHEGAVRSLLAAFTDVTRTRRTIRISHSVERGNPLGARLVSVDDPRAMVVLERGRLPRRCCELLALSGGVRDGTRLQLGPHVTATVVGRGTLRHGLLPDPTELGRRPLLAASLSGPLAPLVRRSGSTTVVSAPLVPRLVHGYAVDDLRDRLRQALARSERGDQLIRGTAPLAVLDELARRARVTRARLLLVAGQAAALIIAFAVFVATARRRDVALVDSQLTTLGASRTQVRVAQAVEFLVPGIVGTAAALLAVWTAADIVAARRQIPHHFVAAALPPATVAAIVLVGIGGAGLLAVSVQPRRRNVGLGALELASITALALLAWQVSSTGGLDPARVAGNGATPVILLIPALAFFASGVILLRVVPFAIRIGERATRRAPVLRLAFLTAGRRPADAAAATTFLAVAVGSALFSLDYRATLDRHAHDQAQFSTGAEWRTTTTPRRDRAPRPGFSAIRMNGTIAATDPPGAQLPVRVLALPAARIPHILGWRDGYSESSRTALARRLRPAAIRLRGPVVASDATSIRVWARARTDFPRQIIVYLLTPDGRFRPLMLGTAGRTWRKLQVPVPPSLEKAQLVALAYRPTTVPISFKYDPTGFVDLGPIEQRRSGDWSPLSSLARWSATTLPTGTAGLLSARRFRASPVVRGTRFEVNGTLQPLVHAPTGLGDALPGFQTPALPALASASVAGQTVDRLLTLGLAGKQVPLRIVARAKLFPTVVNESSRFVVIDYGTLFAALNADQPGVAPPNERWSLGPPLPPPASSASRVERRLRNDPLAMGTRTAMTLAAAVAAALALAGLAVAARASVAAERPMLAEYEALGVPPRLLRRGTQARLLVLSVGGVLAGIAGAVLAVRLIAAIVAVTGTARHPLPPIASVVAWRGGVLVVVAVTVAALLATRVSAVRALRDPPARRLRS